MDTMELFSLRGKTALITGGRTMYGQGASLALADAGASLLLASHSLEPAKAFAAELEREKGISARALAFEQSDFESVRRLVEQAVEAAGRIDVMVHCSRVLPKGSGEGWEQDAAQMRENVRVNSAASLYLLELVGEQMIRQRSGSIVVFGSMMGLVGVERHNYDGNPGMAAGAFGHVYAVDKSGLSAWVRHAASYYGRYGVRINAVCPGGLKSDRTNPVFEAEYSRHTQLGRLAVQDDIRGPVLFLASEASAYMTGLSIPVDGGYTCI